jgi:hypothetical protein
MKILPIPALFAVGVALSGCATIINGTTQSMSLTTPPAEGAMCELRNTEGTWFVTSPGSVTVHKTKNDLVVTCKKDGYQDASLTVPAEFSAVTVGNVLAGGIIGLGVDAASGANYSYPSVTSVPMIVAEPPATPAAPQPGEAGV